MMATGGPFDALPPKDLVAEICEIMPQTADLHYCSVCGTLTNCAPDDSYPWPFNLNSCDGAPCVPEAPPDVEEDDVGPITSKTRVIAPVLSEPVYEGVLSLTDMPY